MDRQNRKEEIFNSLQNMRAMDDLFGIDSGRCILGDMAADEQLAQDIADGMDVRDALARMHSMDALLGDAPARGILDEMISDSMIASDFENGSDLGDAMARQRFWDEEL